MEIKIIDNHNDFLNLKNDWEILQDKANNISFYSTFIYLYNYHNNTNRSTEKKLFIICVYVKNEVVAIAPLFTVLKNIFFLKTNVLKFIGNADFSNVLISREVNEQEVLKKIFEVIYKRLNWDILELTHIAHNTALANFIFKSERYNSYFHSLTENPYLSIQQYADFSDYKKKYFRGKFTYYNNKLKKDYQMYLEVINGDEELNNIAEIHKIRNTKNRNSLFENKKNFEVIKALYKNKDLTLTFLLKTESGEIISYATCYYFNNVLHNWNTSYNPKFKDYSVGEIVYYEMINYAFQHSYRTKMIDFGAGGYPWKFRMTDTFTTTYSLHKINKNSKIYLFLNIYDILINIYKVLFLKYKSVSK